MGRNIEIKARAHDFEYQHVDFKGEGDNRCGFSLTFEGVKELIDEYFEECSIEIEEQNNKEE